MSIFQINVIVTFGGEGGQGVTLKIAAEGKHPSNVYLCQDTTLRGRRGGGV